MCHVPSWALLPHMQVPHAESEDDWDSKKCGCLLLGLEDDARRVLKGAIDRHNNGVRAARRLGEDVKGQFGFRPLVP
jgi:hypothetical protein